MAVKSPKNQGLPDYDSPHGTLAYEWSEMGFLSSSSTSWNIMICFNVPDSIISGLQSSLPTMAILELASENARIVDLDDPPSKRRKEQLAAIFEISRQATQLVETTQMAAETVDRMRIECESFAAAQKTPDRMLAQRARRLGFVHSMVRGLAARAVTNEKRLANEQNLLSNLIAQDNSEILSRLAAANNDED
ncbi:hypothetical protein E4T52_01639 [Aureobasidium sp. EXF-3400]|nr:hypothetical protein E4T52_01639 [Aureobasidium sp. EXF-3400]